MATFSGDAGAQTAEESNYRGWETLKLSSQLIEVQVAPAIGGRVIQYKLGDFEYLFVDEQLAGKEPPPSGVGPGGEWLNYGGEKLWPAPQGWDNDRQWPGPPDAILDGGPHEGRIIAAGVGLTSQKDPRSGIQFSRTIQVFDGSSRVHVDATMTNINTKPRRWGIWSVLQHNAANRTGPGYNDKLHVYCPINPKSVFPDGYKVMFGLANNASWQPDYERGMMKVHFQRRVGKIGMDCAAGWVATVDGQSGHVLAQRFSFAAGKAYPDRASVEIWLNGLGQFVVAGEIAEMPDDPAGCPYLIETELLSPFADLKPGESYTFGYDWYGTTIGGDYPVLGCTEFGVTCEPFTARVTDGKLSLGGRFGVFYQGTTAVEFLDADGKPLGEAKSGRSITPLEPLVFGGNVRVPEPPKGTQMIGLVVYDPAGRRLGELARTKLEK